jgi:peptidoglycan/xylan/chitin deacetylase (PgdA/CDA1 family)
LWEVNNIGTTVLKNICVLAFHDLIEDGEVHKSIYSITCSEFEQILVAAKNSGMRLLLASELSESVDQSLAITFDDGYEDTFHIALPLLNKYQIPATLFIPPKYVGQDGYMDVGKLREWQAKGCEIGAHGFSHMSLTLLSQHDAKYELYRSKSDLESLLGTNIDTMSFPKGCESNIYHRLAFEAGFKILFTSKPDFSQFFQKVIGRFAIHADNGLCAVKSLIENGDARHFRIQKALYHLHKMLGTYLYDLLRRTYMRL